MFNSSRLSSAAIVFSFNPSGLGNPDNSGNPGRDVSGVSPVVVVDVTSKFIVFSYIIYMLNPDTHCVLGS